MRDIELSTNFMVVDLSGEIAYQQVRQIRGIKREKRVANAQRTRESERERERRDED